MDSITQSELHKLFDDYMKDKVCNEIDENKKMKWYFGQLAKFVKQINDEGLTVRPGFYVNDQGERIEDVVQ